MLPTACLLHQKHRWIIHVIARNFLNNVNFLKTSWPRFSNYDKAKIANFMARITPSMNVKHLMGITGIQAMKDLKPGMRNLMSRIGIITQCESCWKYSTIPTADQGSVDPKPSWMGSSQTFLHPTVAQGWRNYIFRNFINGDSNSLRSFPSFLSQKIRSACWDRLPHCSGWRHLMDLFWRHFMELLCRIKLSPSRSFLETNHAVMARNTIYKYF